MKNRPPVSVFVLRSGSDQMKRFAEELQAEILHDVFSKSVDAPADVWGI